MDDRTKASEPPQIEFDFGILPAREGARFLLEEIDKATAEGSYKETIRALRKFNDYVWKTFYRRSN